MLPRSPSEASLLVAAPDFAFSSGRTVSGPIQGRFSLLGLKLAEGTSLGHSRSSGEGQLLPGPIEANRQ